MENMWSWSLRYLGWSLHAAKQREYNIAYRYNMYTNRYNLFCKDREIEFSHNSNIPSIANSLYEIADGSDCPESVLHTDFASNAFLFDALGKASPMAHPDI